MVTTIEEIQIRGFEADFSFQASDAVTLFGGIGLLDSEIQQNNNRPLSVGNDVPQAPNSSFNLGASIEMPISTKVGFFARADWQYVGDTQFHTLQGEQTPTIFQAFFGPGLLQDFTNSERDAFNTLNIRLGFAADNWSVTAWGRNITDEQYLDCLLYTSPSPRDRG